MRVCLFFFVHCFFRQHQSLFFSVHCFCRHQSPFAHVYTLLLSTTSESVYSFLYTVLVDNIRVRLYLSVQCFFGTGSEMVNIRVRLHLSVQCFCRQHQSPFAPFWTVFLSTTSESVYTFWYNVSVDNIRVCLHLLVQCFCRQHQSPFIPVAPGVRWSTSESFYTFLNNVSVVLVLGWNHFRAPPRFVCNKELNLF